MTRAPQITNLATNTLSRLKSKDLAEGVVSVFVDEERSPSLRVRTDANGATLTNAPAAGKSVSIHGSAKRIEALLGCTKADQFRDEFMKGGLRVRGDLPYLMSLARHAGD